MMRALLLVLGAVLALGLVTLADDGSVAWPNSDDGGVACEAELLSLIQAEMEQHFVERAGKNTDRYQANVELSPLDDDMVGIQKDWACFSQCFKWEYKNCIAKFCAHWGWFPPIYKPCAIACAGAASAACWAACP